MLNLSGPTSAALFTCCFNRPAASFATPFDYGGPIFVACYVGELWWRRRVKIGDTRLRRLTDRFFASGGFGWFPIRVFDLRDFCFFLLLTDSPPMMKLFSLCFVFFFFFFNLLITSWLLSSYSPIFFVDCGVAPDQGKACSRDLQNVLLKSSSLSRERSHDTLPSRCPSRSTISSSSP